MTDWLFDCLTDWLSDDTNFRWQTVLMWWLEYNERRAFHIPCWCQTWRAWNWRLDKYGLTDWLTEIPTDCMIDLLICCIPVRCTSRSHCCIRCRFRILQSVSFFYFIIYFIYYYNFLSKFLQLSTNFTQISSNLFWTAAIYGVRKFIFVLIIRIFIYILY